MRSRGFTLVELLVVLVVLALVMAVMPRLFAGGQGRELAIASHDLASVLREARGLALRSGHTAAVIIDLSTGTYRLMGSDQVHRLPSRMHLTLLTTAEDRVDAASASIRFFADGSSTGGRVTLSEGSRSAAVGIDWLTGRVSLNDSIAAPGSF